MPALLRRISRCCKKARNGARPRGRRDSVCERELVLEGHHERGVLTEIKKEEPPQKIKKFKVDNFDTLNRNEGI